MQPGPKVLYICAQGRSGSTVLGNLLGELDGFVSVGELRRLWENIAHGNPCGCGAPIGDCPFWTRVLEQVASDHPETPVERVLEIQRRFVSARPRALLEIGRAQAGGPTAEYARLVDSVYRAVADQSGAKVVVDGSKGPQDAYAIARFTEADLYLVHMVRDPRAIVHAWWLRARKPAGHPEMPRRSPRWSVSRWLLRNAFAELYFRRRLGDRYTLLRYEDFVADPAAVPGAICELLGESSQSIAGLQERAVTLGVHHTAGGNPFRMQTGPVRIEPREQWRTELGRGRKAAVALATLPLLLRYRYPLLG